MSDISAAYVQIPNSCIREAISRMEYLSNVKDEGWERETDFFDRCCQTAIDDVYGISGKTNTNMDGNITRRTRTIQTRAIEAAAQNEH
jgi:hypothetical protein